MDAPSFNREFQPRYGECVRLSPTVARVVAHNPGPFTFYGTGTYIVGGEEAIVIDPGPALPEHLDALLRTLKELGVRRLAAIAVTHTHRDHSPLSRPLQEKTGAPIYGFGPHGGAANATQVEEGADRDFRPDHRLADGEGIEAGAGADGDGPWRLEAVHTPGHTSNHLCFAYAREGALFCGDHVMGWSTTVISPPDGNMANYLQSLDKLFSRQDAIYYPTHGAPIAQPHDFVRSLISHRLQREAAILDCVTMGRGQVTDMVGMIYRDLPHELHGAAGRSVLAHLEKLAAEGRVTRTANGAAADGFWVPVEGQGGVSGTK